MKKLIVCCDGTNQNGTVLIETGLSTNALRLARAINTHDEKGLPQIVFYQSGIGSEHNFYTEYLKEWAVSAHAKPPSFMQHEAQKMRELYVGFVSMMEGMTGGPLAGKVQEAYSFIADNYEPGDKICLFGFSRGAYTARMVAAFIGEVGILTRKGMKRFGKAFAQYQVNSLLPEAERTKAKETIKGKLTKDGDLFPDPNGFLIECVGVFDTVGSVGLPVEVRGSVTPRNIFGFSDAKLGAHISRAYQALALDEKRTDFLPVLFEQTKEGLDRKQVLVQCWFRGAHSDIGGGYIDHDLSDLSLIWMVSNIQDMISVDIDYLKAVPEPTNSWGKGVVHNSLTGVYEFAKFVSSRISHPPTLHFFQNDFTHEFVHPSVLEKSLPDDVKDVCASPKVICKLRPFEETMRTIINVAPKRAAVIDPVETVNPLKLAAEEFTTMLGKFISGRNTLWGKATTA